MQKKLDPAVFKIGCSQAGKNKWVEMGKQVSRKVTQFCGFLVNLVFRIFKFLLRKTFSVLNKVFCCIKLVLIAYHVTVIISFIGGNLICFLGPWVKFFFLIL